jgi:hypothetical protein
LSAFAKCRNIATPLQRSDVSEGIAVPWHLGSMGEAAYKQRHQHNREDDRQNASIDAIQHQPALVGIMPTYPALLTLQKKGSGPLIMPATFERHA